MSTCRPRSSLYTLATEPPQIAASAQVSASGPVAPPCSCRLLSHQTLLWHHRHGHPSLPCLRGMHSHLLISGLPRGGEFSSDLLWDFCRGEGILQSFTLPAPPQLNRIAERRIGLVMEVARTSMIHAAAPHFLWPFAVRYAVHQLNLWPRVSLPETSATLRWTGEVCDASVFRVREFRSFVRDTSADKLSARAIRCVFLGFPPDAPGWQFYHPTSRRVIPSLDVTFDKSVPFYRLFPYRSAPPPPPPLFLAPGPPLVDPLPPQGPAPSGIASGGAASGSAEPRGAESEGAGSGGVEPGGAEPGGAGPGGAEPEGVEPGGAESEGAESGGAEPWGTSSSGVPASALLRLSPRQEPLSLQQLREWFAQRTRLWSGAAGAGISAAGDTGAGGVGVNAGAGGTGGAAAAGPRGARTRGTGATGTGSVGGAGAGGAGAGDPAEPGGAGAGGTGAGGVGAGRARAGYTRAVGAGPRGTGAGGAGARGAGAGDTGTIDPRAGGAGAGGAVSGNTATGGTVRLRPVPRPRPPLVPGTHAMALCPSSVPLRVPLPPPPESSLPAGPDPESDLARVASPTVSRLLAIVVTVPSFESTVTPALFAELVDFAAAYRLDYATALVAESESACSPSIGGECALGTDVLEDRQEEFECLAAAVPRFAFMRLAPEGDPDAPDIPTPRSYGEAITGTYVDAVPPSRTNIVDGMWIFRVKRPPGSPPAFKARYVARGFSQQQGVDYFQTFSPTPKMTTLRVLLHVAAQRDYELDSLDFSTAFLQGSLHEEIWLRRPPGFTGSFPAGTQWSLQRPVYGLR
ncbi:unnamed protein product [Closterium sp. NIES-54]